MQIFLSQAPCSCVLRACTVLLFASWCSLRKGSFQSVQSLELRLVNGSNSSEGRVEVYHKGMWGTVCDDDWDWEDADVVCHQMGYFDAVEYKTGAYYGAGAGKIWMDNVHCSGSENNIELCTFNGWGVNDCTHSEDAGVICLVPNATDSHVRLMGSGVAYQGRVEVYHHGVWGTVCDDAWDWEDATVVCRQLGYSSAVDYKTNAYYGQGTGQIWMDNVDCDGNEGAIQWCVFNGWGVNDCIHFEDAGVVCLESTATLPVRLVGGNMPYQGRVEIYYNGTWGTVCDDGWNMDNSDVVCRQLGYSIAENYRTNAYFGSGSGPIWMDDVTCGGIENELQLCPFNGWGANNCQHTEDVGVICTGNNSCRVEGNVRLVGGSSDAEGRVEVCHNGQWGTVCDDLWDDQDAYVVCNELGYSTELGAAKSRAYFGSGNGPIWMDDVQCTGNEQSLKYCNFPGFGSNDCTHSEDAGVTCCESVILAPSLFCHGNSSWLPIPVATSNFNTKSREFTLIVGFTVSSTGVIIIVVVVMCVIAWQRRHRRGRMATYSVVMRHGQDGDQSCLIVNQQPAAQVVPVGCHISESPVAGRLAFGPPPTEKGVLEPVVPFQSYVAQPFATVTQPMQFTAQLPEFSSHGRQPVQHPETM